MTASQGKAGERKPRFRLTAQKPLENALLGQVIDYLSAQQARGRIAWFARCNGGGVFNRAGQFLRFYVLYLRGKVPAGKGMADLHGMLSGQSGQSGQSGGKYFALEVKRPGEKPTAEQLAFLEEVRAGGGIAAVVRGYEDVPSLLFGEIDSQRGSADG